MPHCLASVVVVENFHPLNRCVHVDHFFWNLGKPSSVRTGIRRMGKWWTIYRNSETRGILMEQLIWWSTESDVSYVPVIVCWNIRDGSVLHAAARLVYRLRRYDHVTDALATLHWLRLPERLPEICEDCSPSKELFHKNPIHTLSDFPRFQKKM